ncbi:hypothetical protein D3C76_1713090 [compost metagenome]
MQNDLLLDSDKLRISNLHAQISPSDHYRIASCDQLIKGLIIGNGLSSFDF